MPCPKGMIAQMPTFILSHVNIIIATVAKSHFNVMQFKMLFIEMFEKSIILFAGKMSSWSQQ